MTIHRKKVFIWTGIITLLVIALVAFFYTTQPVSFDIDVVATPNSNADTISTDANQISTIIGKQIVLQEAICFDDLQQQGPCPLAIGGTTINDYLSAFYDQQKIMEQVHNVQVTIESPFVYFWDNTTQKISDWIYVLNLPYFPAR